LAAAQELKAAGIVPVTADITQFEELQRLSPEYDWVINCVSASGGGADEYQAVYCQGTRNLLEWLSTASPRKFVYTSSTGVYGQTDASWVEESSLTEPGTVTGKILMDTERMLLEAHQRLGFPAVIVRVAGIYGPGRGYWLKQFLNGEARVEGEGERLTNMIHVEDVVGVIRCVLEKGRPGEVYNAVDDEPVSQLALFEWLSSRLDKPLPAKASQMPGQGRRGLTHKRVSNRKLKNTLGYRFKYPTFREGFEGEIRRLEGQAGRSANAKGNPGD
jgi:nucleoside-diphosphate-sugar epimerase